MDKIKILVACHKKAEVWQDDVYTPIQVGKALHPELDLGYICDNTGENISELNPYYCELTAQYWGWKNLDCEYIGLCHYRRYFEKKFTAENVDEIMSDCDIVLSSPIHRPYNVARDITNEHLFENLIIFQNVVKKVCPDYCEVIDAYLKSNVLNPRNMFVCKKSFFDGFAQWQFAILDELFKQTPMSPFVREKRLMGFFGEYLLPIYCIKNGAKVKTMKLVDVTGELVDNKSAFQNLKEDVLFAFQKKKGIHIPASAYFGIKLDD